MCPRLSKHTIPFNSFIHSFIQYLIVLIVSAKQGSLASRSSRAPVGAVPRAEIFRFPGGVFPPFPPGQLGDKERRPGSSQTRGFPAAAARAFGAVASPLPGPRGRCSAGHLARPWAAARSARICAVGGSAVVRSPRRPPPPRPSPPVVGAGSAAILGCSALEAAAAAAAGRGGSPGTRPQKRGGGGGG